MMTPYLVTEDVSDRKLRRILLAGLALTGFIALLGAGLGLVWFASGPSFTELRSEGNEVIAALEHYREAHGRYPTSLAELDASPRLTRYGPWEYESDGKEFMLSIGDYGKYGFVYFYSSDWREWYADT